jgi:hypothetical protein
MKKWHAEKPEIFIKRPRNHTGPDMVETLSVCAVSGT